MSPAIKGSKIMASPMRMRTAAADSAMVGETTIAVSAVAESFVLPFSRVASRCGRSCPWLLSSLSSGNES